MKANEIQKTVKCFGCKYATDSVIKNHFWCKFYKHRMDPKTKWLDGCEKYTKIYQVAKNSNPQNKTKENKMYIANESEVREMLETIGKLTMRNGREFFTSYEVALDMVNTADELMVNIDLCGTGGKEVEMRAAEANFKGAYRLCKQILRNIRPV